jgi:hypothetical protein
MTVKQWHPLLTLMFFMSLSSVVYAEPAPESPVEQSWASAEGKTPTRGARRAFIGIATSAGLLGYGPASLALLESNSERLNIGTYLLTAGSAFLVPTYMLGRNDINWAMTDLLYAGITRGAFHGSLLSSLGEVETDDVTADQYPDDTTNSTSENATVLLTAGLSLTEGILGTVYAKSANLSSGETHTLTIMSDLGALWGTMLTLPVFQLTGATRPAEMALIGSVAGFGAGEYYRRIRPDTTWGDAEFLRTSAVLGLVAPLPIFVSADINDVRLLTYSTLVSSAAGFYLGDKLLTNLDLEYQDALLLDLSVVSGALLLPALTYLITGADGPTAYAWTSVAGAAAGYVYMYNDIKNSTPNTNNRSEQRSSLVTPWFAPESAPGRGEVTGLSMSGTF